MDQWPFYRAADSKVGDVMPCWFDGKFRIYYLRFGVYGHKAYNEWSVRETEDFVHYSEDRRVGIYGGTGEILPLNGKYHLFKEVEPNVIGHYIGDTPYAFSDTGLRLPSDDHFYAPWAWRDPKILWVPEEDCWWMLVATNRKTDTGVCRHGCVGLCKSKDLYHWDYAEPLYSPLAYDGTYECPDLFQLGDWWYLVYSNANVNKLTHYVKGRTKYGPWLMPEDDTLDSFLFYAGRTASDGKRRYIAAWNPERTGQDLSMQIGLRDVDKTPMTKYEDFAPLGYAGDMVLHRLGQKDNGDLTLELIPAIRAQYTKAVPFCFRGLQGARWQTEEASASVDSPGIYSCGLAQTLPDRCLIEMDLRVSGHEAGLALGTDGAFYGKGVYLRFRPKEERVTVVSGLRDRPYVGYCLPFLTEQEKIVRPEEGGVYHVQILRSGELFTVYINGAALSFRASNVQEGALGLYAFDGSLRAGKLSVRALEQTQDQLN